MTPRDFEANLLACEANLEQLRVRFEQYFQGLERIAPEREHEAVQRQIRELQREIPPNTALRFRYQQLKQKRVTLATYWTRVCRQIEEGTYQRDVLRARKRKAQRPKRSAAAAIEIDVDMDMDMDMDAEVNAALEALGGDSPAAAPVASKQPGAVAHFKPPAAAVATFGKPAGARPPSIAPPPRARTAPPARTSPRPPPPPPRPTASAASGMADDSMRRIYDTYLEARRRNNERVDNVKIATLKKSIDKMMPKLRAKHGSKRIDFEVVVKDGRVGLKPVAK